MYNTDAMIEEWDKLTPELRKFYIGRFEALLNGEKEKDKEALKLEAIQFARHVLPIALYWIAKHKMTPALAHDIGLISKCIGMCEEAVKDI